MECVVYIATSLDGFIARPDGAIDWLMAADGGGEDYGAETFGATLDGMAMGRHTYETVLGFEVPWPYGVPVHVLTSRPLEVPPELEGKVFGAPADAVAAHTELRDRGYERVWVDGGRTIQGFLAAGLIDELILTRIPVLIGEGISLFGPIGRDVTLELVETRGFRSGFTQCRYRVSGS